MAFVIVSATLSNAGGQRKQGLRAIQRLELALLVHAQHHGLLNLFVAIEPEAGRRTVSLSDRRGKVDFVVSIQEMITRTYAKTRRIHLVLDNLNIHFRKCFDEMLGHSHAARLLRRVQFHYTPKHASWLNMAEIGIGILFANA